MKTSSHPFIVRPGDVAPYHPANHSGTVNRRLIGADNVGASRVEVVLGVIEPGQGAHPHAHPGIEQVCYMLEGRARAEIGGESCEIGPGECCFFPAGVAHSFAVVGATPARILVIYSPPYGEDPAKSVRGGAENQASDVGQRHADPGSAQ
jgi:mannose-6-phosphate isomerase-like protein (cupin superfamily)